MKTKKSLLTLSVLFILLLFSCGTAKLVMLPRPVFDKHYSSKNVPDDISSRNVSFKLLEEKTDALTYLESCKAWFSENDLSLRAVSVHEGFEMMPLKTMQLSKDWVTAYKTYSHKEKTYYLSHIVEQEHVVLFFYGEAPNEFKVVQKVSVLVIRDRLNEQLKAAFDFSEFAYSPEFTEKVKEFVYQGILWAYVENDIVYVSNAHWTYSNTSKEQNGYITAIRLKDKKILWRTEPKVANSINFAVAGDLIISAYGYTREGATVFAIDKRNGKTAGSLELAAPKSGKKHIEFIFNKNNTIYLKAFDNTAYKVAFQ